MLKVDIRNLNDLQKWANSSSGVSSLINKTNIMAALISECERLQTYLIDEINTYLSSYSPVQYLRTGAWLESIQVNPPVQEGNEYSITITFDDKAYHPSVLGQEDGYVPWLMEEGWDIRDKFGGLNNRFTYFSGTHYIKNAVTRWNNDNKYGFKITVYHGDEVYI